MLWSVAAAFIDGRILIALAILAPHTGDPLNNRGTLGRAG